MTDAPEEVLLQPCPAAGWAMPDRVKYNTGHAFKYIREDVALAMVAAEWDAAIQEALAVVEEEKDFARGCANPQSREHKAAMSRTEGARKVVERLTAAAIRNRSEGDG